LNKENIGTMEVIKVSIFTSIYSCLKKELTYKDQLIKESLDILDKKLDVYIYIRNMILIDIMYQILIDNKYKDSINFLSRSMIYLNKKKEEEEIELNEVYKSTSKVNLDKLYNQFTKLIEKTEKTEIEKK